MFFQKVKSVVAKVDPKTGLNRNIDRIYAVFLVHSDTEDDTSGEFVIMKGRKEVFQYCMDYAVTGDYDLLKSQILSENMTLGNEVSLYTFMRLSIEYYKYEDMEILEYIHELIMTDKESITTEYLDKFYNQECNQSAR